MTNIVDKVLSELVLALDGKLHESDFYNKLSPILTVVDKNKRDEWLKIENVPELFYHHIDLLSLFLPDGVAIFTDFSYDGGEVYFSLVPKEQNNIVVDKIKNYRIPIKKQNF